jgi:hypothetical protein
MRQGAVLLLVFLAGASPPSGGGVPASVHDLHLSHTRMVLEERAVVLRIRLFHDDLQQALRRFSGDSTLRLTADHRADSLFGAYAARALRLEADGRPVPLTVSGSGTEQDQAAQEVVWYVLEGGLERSASQLMVLNGVLFELFRDQQNIVQLLRLPEDRRRTLYFTAQDPGEQRFAP